MADHDLQPPVTPPAPEAQEGERLPVPVIPAGTGSADVAMPVATVADTDTLDAGTEMAGFEALSELVAADVGTDAAEDIAPALDTVEVPAAQPAVEPVPDISTLSAAKDAAAFVAQIFADPSISDAADSEVTAVQAAAEQEPVVELPPVPALWPQGQADRKSVV